MNSQNTIFFNFIHKNKYLFGLVISILIFINYNLINWIWSDKFIYKKIVTFNAALSDTLSHFYQNDIITFTIYEVNKNTLNNKIKALNLNDNHSFQIEFQTNLNFKEASKVMHKVVDNSSKQVALELKKQLRTIGYDGIIEEKQRSLFIPRINILKSELKFLRLNFEKILDRHDEQFQIKYNLEGLKLKDLEKKIKILNKKKKDLVKKIEILNKRGESKNSIITKNYLEQESKNLITTKNYLEQFDVLRYSLVKDANDHMQYRKVIRSLIFDQATSALSLNPFGLYINESQYCKNTKDKSKSCDVKIEILKIMSEYLAIRFQLKTINEFLAIDVDKKFNLFKKSFVNNLQTKNILKLIKLLDNDIMKIDERYSMTKKIAPGKIFILILSVFNSFVLGIVFWALLFKLNWRIYFLKY